MRKKKAAGPHPERLKKVIAALSDHKVEDLTILDVRDLISYTDYFIIATGKNSPHVQALADAAVQAIKVPHARGLPIEGYQAATWVLVDGGDFVLHVFQPDARTYYALEELWADAKSIDAEALSE